MSWWWQPVEAAAQLAGASAQDITLPLVESTPEVFAPTIAGTASNLALPLVGGDPAIYAPTLTPKYAIVLPLASSGGTYADEVLADGPVSYWRLGESSGLPQDCSGNGHHATDIVGTITRGVAGALAGDADTSISKGPSSWANAPAASLQAGDVLTIEVWFRRTSTGAVENIFGNRTVSGTGFLLGLMADGAIFVLWASTYFWTTAAGVTNDTAWHHLVFTKDGSTRVFYLDGEVVSASGTNVTMTNLTDVWAIGSTGNRDSSPIEGGLDELAVYDYALSASRVEAHYNAATAPAAAAIAYAPTLLPQYAISLPLAESTPATYEPVISGTGSSPQDLTVPLVGGDPAIYAPTIAPAPYPITLPLVESEPAAYAPVLLPAQFLTVPLVESTPGIYEPVISAAPRTFVVPLVESTPSLYPPTLTGINAVVLPLASSDPDAFAPALSVVIALPLVESMPAAFAPTLTPGALTMVVPLVGGDPAIYPPVLTAEGGTQSLELPVVESTPAAYAPVLTAEYALDLPLVGDGPTLYAPVLVPVSTVTLPLVTSDPAAYAPTILPGAYAVALPLVESTPDAYAPVLLPAAVTLNLPLADSAAAAYAPTIEGILTQLLELPLIESEPGLWAPAIAKASVVISGVTRNQYGAPIASCTVDVFRSDTNAFVATTTSDTAGRYSVMVPGGHHYFLVAYSAARVYGVTARDIEGE